MEYQVTRVVTYWIEAIDSQDAIELAKTGAFDGEEYWEVNV